MIQYLLAGRYQERYVQDFIKPAMGARILDVGCGPGDIVAYLPATVEYVGFDMNDKYIQTAKRRFEGREGGPKCRFFRGLVNDAAIYNFDAFDIVTANSVLHHLTDNEAGVLFELAKKALRPSGRLITLDPCYLEDQSRIARFLLSWDRGRHIRTDVRYRALASEYFTRVTSSVLHDLLRVPYTNIITECTK
jgi:SAM-dependent methyltransferase